MNKNAWLVIGAIALVIVIAVIADKCEPQVVVTKPADSVFYWHDKYNNEVASLKGYQEQFGYRESLLLDSIAKVHRSKVKYIKEVVVITQQGETQIVSTEKPVIRYVDSAKTKIKSLSEIFFNPWYVATATIDITGESSRLELQSTDTISVVWKQVKEGNIFHRKNFLQLDVTNKNPYNHIIALEAYRVPAPKPKKFGIGIQVGYGFSTGLQPSAYIGVGASYNIIRF